MDNREALETLYLAVLGRLPNPDTFEKRLAALDSGAYDFQRMIRDVYARKNELGNAPMAFPAGHFYSPITDPELVARHMAKLKPVSEVAGIKIDRERMIAFWHELAPLLAEQPFPDEQAESGGYWFQNPAFSYGDGTMLHSMIRHFQPRQIVEVGSGYSSLCMLDTVAAHLDHEPEITFIEPFAALLKDLTGNHAYKKTRIVEAFVQDVPLAEFERLEANDILFIDSTHVLKTGSDVAFELAEILPRMASGTIVHIHDIFWPFEYPKNWVVGHNRSWNELYGVRQYLCENPNWEIIFFNDYMNKNAKDELAAQAPWFVRNTGGSIWLRRV